MHDSPRREHLVEEPIRTNSSTPNIFFPFHLLNISRIRVHSQTFDHGNNPRCVSLRYSFKKFENGWINEECPTHVPSPLV